MKYLIILFFTLNSYALTEVDYRTTFTAIAKVESTLRSYAYNRSENAVGIVQIRSLYLIDANEYLGTNYSHKDCYDVSISYDLFKAYMKRYKAKTVEECIRLHSLGPRWKGRSWKANVYYNKVKKHLP